jgi:hypothetical protein
MRDVALSNKGELPVILDPIYPTPYLETLLLDVVEPGAYFQHLVEVRGRGILAERLHDREVPAVGKLKLPKHLHLAYLEVVHEGAVVNDLGCVRFAVSGPGAGNKGLHNDQQKENIAAPFGAAIAFAFTSGACPGPPRTGALPCSGPAPSAGGT